jgi:alkanesulfonate monooxygenase SsuD/methylene tetrahydromethanopterin reductase-like flavin-dependent oxidoreductase (luciferase family)
MRFGFAVPSYGAQARRSAVRDLLVAGDELGFDSAWFPDHVAVPDYATAANLDPPFLEPMAACAWALGFTERIRVGTDVLVAAYRHPLLVAAMSGTVARLSGDRFTLGVGIGYLRGEFDVLGAAPYEDRASTTESFLRTLRSPPAGYSVVSSGEAVPVWVGGNRRAAERRAALLGDGWHPLWMPDTDYAAARRRILEARSSAGIDGPFTFSYSCGATAVLDRSPTSWPSPPPRPPEGSEFRYSPPTWVDVDGRPRFVGTPDQVIADFRLLAAAGVEHVTLRFGTTEPGDLERFARQVRPAFSD